MLIKYITIGYSIIFSIPLLLPIESSVDYLLSLLIIITILTTATITRPKTNKANNVKIYKNQLPLNQTLILFTTSTLITISIATFLGHEGLTARDTVRSDARNFNEEGSQFISAQINFILIASAAALLNYGINRKSKIILIAGSVLAAYILSSSGTRWNWLLACSPILLQAVINLSYKKLIPALLGLAIAMLFISAKRGSGDSLPLYAALLWDIPSLQSNWVILNTDPKIIDIKHFLNGQVLVLIPRFLWPDKPIDEATTNYMVSLIGERFYMGATILPGFIGSAWLYGGFAGIILFTTLLAIIVKTLDLKLNQKNNRNIDLGIVGLIFFGSLLQTRGISIFYFMPAIYYIAGKYLIQIHSRKKKNRPLAECRNTGFDVQIRPPKRRQDA